MMPDYAHLHDTLACSMFLNFVLPPIAPAVLLCCAVHAPWKQPNICARIDEKNILVAQKCFKST